MTALALSRIQQRAPFHHMSGIFRDPFGRAGPLAKKCVVSGVQLCLGGEEAQIRSKERSSAHAQKQNSRNTASNKKAPSKSRCRWG